MSNTPVPPSARAAQKPPKKHRRFALWAVLGLLGATTALCSAIFAFARLDSRHVCTLEATPAGISVDIVPAIADTVSEATLTACWDGACQERPFGHGMDQQSGLSAGDPVMSTESAAATESPAASPTRTSDPDERHVFIVLNSLPAKPVDVTVVLRSQNGAPVLRERIRVTPQVVRPNGRNCTPGGPQAHLQVTGEGRLTLHAQSANTPTPGR
ncbi:hypothetical protein [Streptomyces sp. NPDC000994]